METTVIDKRYRFLNFCLLILYNYLFYSIYKIIWPGILEQNLEKEKIYQMISLPLFFLGFIIPYIFYSILYIKKIPFFEQYKVNAEPWPWEKEPNFRTKFKKTLILITINFGIGIIFTNILNRYIKLRIVDYPDFLTHLLHFFLCALTTSFYFYWSHRFLHIPYLYKKIHKIHHEYYNTIIFTTTYAHPLEFIIGNVLPKYMFVFMMGSHLHVMTFYCYFLASIILTNEEHSGYEFPISFVNWNPFEGNSDFHNFHHFKNIGNYGGFLFIWDKIFKTDCYYKEYLKNKKFK
jgi:sterol desaturase/sphingolipid hydroxylase (fatty acid hydroxylase superfamily)